MVMHDKKEIPKELSNNMAKRWEQENDGKINEFKIKKFQGSLLPRPKNPFAPGLLANDLHRSEYVMLSPQAINGTSTILIIFMDDILLCFVMKRNRFQFRGLPLSYLPSALKGSVLPRSPLLCLPCA